MALQNAYLASSYAAMSQYWNQISQFGALRFTTMVVMALFGLSLAIAGLLVFHAAARDHSNIRSDIIGKEAARAGESRHARRRARLLGNGCGNTDMTVNQRWAEMYGLHVEGNWRCLEDFSEVSPSRRQGARSENKRRAQNGHTIGVSPLNTGHASTVKETRWHVSKWIRHRNG